MKKTKREGEKDGRESEQKETNLSELACAESERHFSFGLVINGGRQRLMGERLATSLRGVNDTSCWR